MIPFIIKIQNKINIILDHVFFIHNLKSNSIYLTFDDGPEKGITEFVLKTLDDYHAKATFFCVGNNIIKNKDLFQEIKKKGHSFGCHTMSHMNGRETPILPYVKDAYHFHNKWRTNLFRPPYGSIGVCQSFLLRLKYRIILWDVDSTDWYNSDSNNFNINYIVSKIHPGSIILFHFCALHQHRTKKILPLVLEYRSNQGYKLEAICCN